MSNRILQPVWSLEDKPFDPSKIDPLQKLKNLDMMMYYIEQDVKYTEWCLCKALGIDKENMGL